MSRNNSGISFGSVMIWFGLFFLVTLPLMLIVINREHIDVSIKTGDNTVKELKIEREDLLRGREIEKDSLSKLSQTLNKKDSTIIVLEYRLKKQNKKIDSLNNMIRTMQMSGNIKKIVK